MKITEKYRPVRLSEVAAQKTATRKIENAIERSGLAGSSWWIAGATGTGKTTIARILADEFAQNEFTIHEFVGRDVSVDDLREYEERMRVKPMGAGRCLIINEAQDLSDSAVSILLALVEKVNASKTDMIVFTAMVDVLELKNDPMNRWRALVGRCNQVDLADTDSPAFQAEAVDYLEGIAASEGISGVDVAALCEKAGWSIRAALNDLDTQERGDETVEEESAIALQTFPIKVEILKNGYAIKSRATRFVIKSRRGNGWQVCITNHMTNGAKMKFFDSLEEIEKQYKSLKGIAAIHHKLAN